MDYVEFGGKNLWMPGRKWAHTREDGAACRAEVGPLLRAQRWTGIHHPSADTGEGGGTRQAAQKGAVWPWKFLVDGGRT